MIFDLNCRYCSLFELTELCVIFKILFKFHRRFLEREMPMVPKLSMPITDVRDVAGAHITAMTSPKAPGKTTNLDPSLSLVFLSRL